LLDEVCFEALVDDLHVVAFTATGKDVKGATVTKSFTLHSFPGNEFKDEEVPTAVVAIYDHKKGYGGMDNVGEIISGIVWFSRAFTADVEIRLHAREMKVGNAVVHARDLTKAMLDAVKKRVRAYWDHILLDYFGSVIDDSLEDERDYQDFIDGNTESMRLLRFQIRYEEHWTKMRDAEVPEGGEIVAIELSATDGNEDIPTTVQKEET